MTDKRTKKKEQFVAEQQTGGTGRIVALLAIVALACGIGWLLFGQGLSDGSTRVKSVAGVVRIDLNSVNDGQAHYFKFAGQNGEIRFFVVKSIDGKLRAAFDACDVCFREKKGYLQNGDYMVCNNCGQKFRTDLVNEIKGGCNPAPLQRRIEEGQVVINERDILNGVSYFGG